MPRSLPPAPGAIRTPSAELANVENVRPGHLHFFRDPPVGPPGIPERPDQFDISIAEFCQAVPFASRRMLGVIF
jgi:hypothetical protein